MKTLLTVVLVLLLFTGNGIAAANEESPRKSADEVARELANPNNSLASLTFKNQYRWHNGDLPLVPPI